jgi:simple sugar transport system ATP-binding protein
MAQEIELKNITKRFGSKVVANHNVSLAINQGEILALLGENGSGKTTLMNMLSGSIIPTKGRF